MNTSVKKYHILAALVVFVLLPAAFFYFGDFARRSLLKESLSFLTVLGFSLMLGQFFWARSDQLFVRAFKFSHVLSVHKFIGYSVVALFLLHPLLIVLPRYYEGGIHPVDALIQMLTTFDSLGVILGLISWVQMLAIGVTSLFRDQLNMSYKSWKLMHGLLSISFISIASWHAIELGRHTDEVISIFIALMAIWGVMMLIAQYVTSSHKTAGAKS